MSPTLFWAGEIAVPSFAVFAGLGFVVAFLIRKHELRRLRYVQDPRHRYVGVGALVGAAIGAKLGMLLFISWDEAEALMSSMLDLDLTGKTVVGALAGGYLGVEATKRLVGIVHSTGDGFAVALPAGQAVGRVGCFLHGCCYGTPSDLPWAIALGGVLRHPAQLYEAGLDLLLAGVLWQMRGDRRPEGHLFRWYLVGYAAIRFVLEPLRGDAGLRFGVLTATQIVCAMALVGFVWSMAPWRRA